MAIDCHSQLLLMIATAMIVSGRSTVSHGEVSNTAGIDQLSSTLISLLENTTPPTDSLSKIFTTFSSTNSVKPFSTSASSAVTLNTSSNGTTQKVAISEEFRRKYLQELQAQTTQSMIPAIVCYLLLAVTGVIGNSLVLYVYSSQFVLNGTRVFILNIAAFDLITNLIIIPGEVYDMFNIWDFNQPWLCRIRLYMNALTTIVSANLLTALAVARYRKVCFPFGWQITASRAQTIAVILIFVTVVCAAPFGIINGRYTRETPHPEIFGHECNVDDTFVDTIWPFANSAFVILIYLVNSITIVVLYSMVGVRTWRHSRTIGQGVSSSACGSNLTSDISGISNSTCLVTLAADPPAGTSRSNTRNTESHKKHNCQVKMTPERTVTFSRKESSEKRSTVNKSGKRRKGNDRCQDDQDQSRLEYLTDGSIAVDHTDSVRISQSNADLPIVSRRAKKDSIKSAQLKKLGVNTEGKSQDKNVRVKGNGKRKRKSGGNSLTEGVQYVPTAARPGVGSGEENRYLHDTAHSNTAGESESDKHITDSELDLGHVLESPNVLNTESDQMDDRDEPISSFAESMQWTDITHWLEDDDATEDQPGGQEVTEELWKSNTNSYSRTVSRDKSFLPPDRKSRMNLWKTLPESRKSKPLRKSSSVTALKDLPKRDEKTNLSKSNVNGGGIKPKRSLNRTTIMLIIISAVYIIGFLPCLGLSIYYNFHFEEYKALDTVGLALYYTFLRSYLLNSASNAVIYGIFDLTFRAKCVDVIRQKLCCVKS